MLKHDKTLLNGQDNDFLSQIERKEQEEKRNFEDFETFNEVNTYKDKDEWVQMKSTSDDLDYYLAENNTIKSAKKYQGMAKSKKVKASDHRKESTRKSKYSKAAEYMNKSAELISNFDEKRNNYISKNKGNKQGGDDPGALDLTVEKLDALEVRLKGLRYAAEANALDKNDEELKKAKAELKIRRAQDEIISDRLAKTDKKNPICKDLKKRQKEIRTKIEKYEKNFETYSKKFEKSDAYKKKRALHAKQLTGNNNATYETDVLLEHYNNLADNQKYYNKIVSELGKKYNCFDFVERNLLAPRYQFMWIVDLVRFDYKGKPVPADEEKHAENLENLERFIKCNANPNPPDDIDSDTKWEYEKLDGFITERFLKWSNYEISYNPNEEIKDDPEKYAGMLVRSYQQMVFDNGIMKCDIFKTWMKNNNHPEEFIKYVQRLGTLNTTYLTVLAKEALLYGININGGKIGADGKQKYYLSSQEIKSKEELNGSFKENYAETKKTFLTLYNDNKKKAEGKKHDEFAWQRQVMIDKWYDPELEDSYSDYTMGDFKDSYEEFKKSGQKLD